MREINTFEDSDFTMERFREAYNANLANGIGNLTSRIMKMATMHGIELSTEEKKMTYYEAGLSYENLDNFNIQAEMDDIWTAIQWLDRTIQEKEPFKKLKQIPKKQNKILRI